jgi:hypothetical protein
MRVHPISPFHRIHDLAGCRTALVLVLAASPALAQVRVSLTPDLRDVASGSEVTFHAVVEDPTAPSGPDQAVEWSCRGGARAKDGFPGTFVMPQVERTAIVTVLARSLQDPSAYGERSVSVLPSKTALPPRAMGSIPPGDLAASRAAAPVPVDCKQAGPPGLPALSCLGLPQELEGLIGSFGADAYSRNLPFLDLETGVRFGPADGKAGPVKAQAPARASMGRCHLLGYGLKTDLDLTEVATAGAALLSWREGREVRRMDASGGVLKDFQLRARAEGAQLESLDAAPPDGKGRVSQLHALSLQVRGVVPFAGNAVAEPEHKDGTGVSARFKDPCGLATVWNNNEDLFLVVDAGSHTLRALNREGGVTTLAGTPDKAGHRDGPWDTALFHRPTFVAASPTFASSWSNEHGFPLYVADTGNHVIRAVHGDGTVTTFAGEPQAWGAVNSPKRLDARFNAPTGITLDLEGTLYVADRGNHVIRAISEAGVRVLAGVPGQAGVLDGTGDQARFTDLKGLLWCQGFLFATDGHAIRRISPGGQVVTLCGRVDQAGSGSQADAPCLNDPWGLAAGARDRLLVVDRGNRAVRTLDLREDKATLATLAGGLPDAGPRWGLLRDGAQGPLDPRYAALGDGKGIVYASRSRTALLGQGACLGMLSNWNAMAPPPIDPASLPRGVVEAGSPLSLSPQFVLEYKHSFLKHAMQPEDLTLEWTLELRQPNTEEVLARAGGGATWGPAGTFSRNPVLPIPADARGPLDVRLRILTRSGFTLTETSTITVQGPK